jgi:hypothetical protein
MLWSDGTMRCSFWWSNQENVRREKVLNSTGKGILRREAVVHGEDAPVYLTSITLYAVALLVHTAKVITASMGI